MKKSRFKTTNRSEMVRIEGPDGQLLSVAWDHASNAFLIKGEEAIHSDGESYPCRRLVLIPDTANGLIIQVE